MNFGFDFTPDEQTSSKQELTYIEDADADTYPGYATRRSVDELLDLCDEQLRKMKAHTVDFQPGGWQKKPLRIGYRVLFMIGNRPFVVPLVAAPVRYERNADKARKQVLYAFWMYMQGYNSILRNMPGHLPFMQHMLVDGNKRTLGEYMREENNLPRDVNPPLLDGA